ncbi:hypothetical protein [Hanstruepera marina]|uniref:hypothetical protein n=1 Tax=Hanstruepera marina TaxID=2873265 RepID=UPI001CA61391|nr:hypothetical protein [Hanstruepera marina]
MKKLLILVVLILFVSACSSDDSDNPPQNHAAIGTLVKIEIFRPEEEIRTSTTYFFNSDEKVESALEEAWNGSQYLQATYTYSYNSNGQIWKVTIAVDDSTEYTEFNFTSGLITSSLRHTISGNVLRTLYNYNSDNQLINKQFFNADNEESAISNISFDINGNIESRHDERNFGTEIIDYTFEYDTFNNPLKTPFENQEMNKIIGHNFNNITKTIRSDDFSTSEVNIEYTYNEAGYPLTSKEYSNGNLLVEVTYTYQE